MKLLVDTWVNHIIYSPFSVGRCSIAFSRIEYAFESPAALYLPHLPIQFYFNSSIAQCRPRPNNDSRHGSKEPCSISMWSQRERTRVKSVVEFDLPSYCVKETEVHTVAMETHMTMPRFFFLCDLTEFLLKFHCRFIACFRTSCLFLSTFFLWNFSSPHIFFLFHPSMQSFFFFLGLKTRIISSDLIGSVVQVYFCQYFHWPHHRKNCIVFLRTLFMCVRMKYMYIFN